MMVLEELMFTILDRMIVHIMKMKRLSMVQILSKLQIIRITYTVRIMVQTYRAKVIKGRIIEAIAM